MPAPVVVAAGVAAFLKGLSALLSKKSKDKKAKEKNRAETADLTLKQKQREDQRRSRVRLGSSYLNRVPSTVANGAVNTGVAPDPAVIADLEKERTYDYGSTLPAAGTGSTYEFLSGLFGEAGDTATRAYGAPSLDPAAEAFRGAPQAGSPGSSLTPPGGISRTPFEEVSGSLSIEDLLKQINRKPGDDDEGLY